MSKMLLWLLLLNAVEAKKRGVRVTDGLRKKLTIPDSEILECPEFEVKSKIGKWFMNEKVLVEYSVRIYEIDIFFYEHHKVKIKVDKNGCKYILFSIDVYFTESFFGHRNWWTKPWMQITYFWEDKTRGFRKKTCDAGKGYDTDYEVSNIQIFISKFKNEKIK